MPCVVYILFYYNLPSLHKHFHSLKLNWPLTFGLLLTSLISSSVCDFYSCSGLILLTVLLKHSWFYLVQCWTFWVSTKSENGRHSHVHSQAHTHNALQHYSLLNFSPLTVTWLGVWTYSNNQMFSASCLLVWWAEVPIGHSYWCINSALLFQRGLTPLSLSLAFNQCTLTHWP